MKQTLEARRLAHDEEVDGDEDAATSTSAHRMRSPVRLWFRACADRHMTTAQVINLLGFCGIMRRDACRALSRLRLAGFSGCLSTNGLGGRCVHEAQDFTWQSLAAGFRPGMGQFIPDRFFWARRPLDDDKN
jgi:hydroxymethylpyrimidine/phosphomethylpyrimidine kinase